MNELNKDYDERSSEDKIDFKNNSFGINAS